MNELNRRTEGEPPSKKKVSILVEFPDPHLETVLVQLKQNIEEPLRFPNRKDVPEYPVAEKPPFAIDLPLQDFVDPANGLIFGKYAYLADIVFSMKAFLSMQPEPDLVLPAESLWECRAEALRAMNLADEPGFALSLQR
jgi:hypothetical protein